MNKLITRKILDIILFIIAFVVIQIAVDYASAGIYAYSKGLGLRGVGEVVVGMATGEYGGLLAVATVFSSLITIIFFSRMKWTTLSRSYLASKPWAALLWVVILSLGTIIPCEWLYEQMQINMPEHMEELFESVMREPWGYVAIGVLAPIAEEVVFRGAILRTLLTMLNGKWHWVAIILSAVIFGCAHGNLAQGIHAFVIGCILGWMYYRTGSILPGVVLHWVNNSVAYILYNLFPQMGDGKLIDFFHGNHQMLAGGIFFSLCILLPAIYQLYLRLKKAE